MNKKIKWGILGPGSIAHPFVKALKTIPDAEVRAVGSRSLDRATAFAKEYGITAAYGSYQALVNDPEIDIIYVATPHSLHKDCVLLCLDAGKSVICEKPFTINANETEALIKYAREKKLFLTEAMWTRYLPATIKVREWLSDGVIGDVKMMKADFGFRCGWDPNSRLLNPELGGGALLDVGVYPIAYASMVFGVNPSKISSMVHIGETGVDEECSAIFGYDGGELAILCAAVRTNLTNDAWIFGTKGKIHIPEFWQAKSAALYLDGKEAEVYDLPFESTGYNYEAIEAMRCLREGKIESDIMPLSESLEIMKTMDTIRKQSKIKYPFE